MPFIMYTQSRAYILAVDLCKLQEDVSGYTGANRRPGQVR